MPPKKIKIIKKKLKKKKQLKKNFNMIQKIVLV